MQAIPYIALLPRFTVPYAGGKAGSGTEKQKATPGSADVDADFVDLGKLRRASVSEFKGRKLLNVREYYEKDGEVRSNALYLANPFRQVLCSEA